MPMSPGTANAGTPSLAKEIKDLVKQKNTDFADNMEDQLDWLFEAIAEAVITHITTNMLVVTSVSTVTAQTPVGVSPAETYAVGSGTGTGTSTTIT